MSFYSLAFPSPPASAGKTGGGGHLLSSYGVVSLSFILRFAFVRLDWHKKDLGELKLVHVVAAVAAERNMRQGNKKERQNRNRKKNKSLNHGQHRHGPRRMVWYWCYDYGSDSLCAWTLSRLPLPLPFAVSLSSSCPSVAVSSGLPWPTASYLFL